MLHRCPIVALLLVSAALSCQSPDRVDLTRYVLVYPGRSIVPLPGQAASLPVVVRNVSVEKLTELTLEVKTACCTVAVMPEMIPALTPGDRRDFAITLTRKPGASGQRVPLFVTLRAKELPAPAGMDLMVDLSQSPAGQWMDVGQVKLIPRDDARTVYYLLAGVPLLFVVGWMLWRWSRRGREEEE